MPFDAASKLSRLLRADRGFLISVNNRLTAVTGRRSVLEKLALEHEQLIKQILTRLDPPSLDADSVFDSLLRKLENDDRRLSNALELPASPSLAGQRVFIDTATAISPLPPGLFLKLDVARRLLDAHPPRRVLAYLGYPTVVAALEEINLLELFCSLRFLEGNEWLHSVFFPAYEKLTPSDFEIRAVQIISLSTRWREAARDFVAKKYHNLSHLKELGIIFVLPLVAGTPGETLRTLSLLFHYLHEVSFYSNLFRAAATSSNFSARFTSLLRGDVFDQFPPVASKQIAWLVVQRYLAKDDPLDWRLSYPQINLEALHWTRAARNLQDLSRLAPALSAELSFWSEFDWVGDYFPSADHEVLVSFNMVDAAMSLVRRSDHLRYTYHFPAALWNKLFTSYFSLSELTHFGQSNLFRGWFSI